MKKCEKCQIKVDDNQKNCPICGGKLTVTEDDGSMHILNSETDNTNSFDEPQAFVNPFDAAINLSFTEKLKGVFMQRSISIAIIFMIIYSVYFIINAVQMPATIILGIVPIVFSCCLLYLLLKKEKFEEGLKTVSTVLYGTSIAYLFIYVIIFVLCLLLGIGLLTGLEILNNFMFMAGMDVMGNLAGISFILAAVAAAAIMLPYLISIINITKSIRTGAMGESVKSVKGAVVFKVYSVIELIMISFSTLSFITMGAYDSILAVLFTVAQVLIANALCEFDKILKV